MKTLCRTEGTQTYFVLYDLEPAYHQAVQDLEFTQVEDGFARVFPTNSPHLASAYQNFARSIEEVCLQTANLQPFPWEQALLTLLEKTQSHDIDWWLVGSGALAVRGIAVAPRDLDLATDDAGALALGDVLAEYLIEPVQDARGWICNWFGRAFMHGRVEWVGGVDPAVDEPEASDFGPAAASRMETLRWHGYELRVPPLDLQLQVSERRGLTERARQIRRAL